MYAATVLTYATLHMHPHIISCMKQTAVNRMQSENIVAGYACDLVAHANLHVFQ